ncbi:MAG: hypothetical protein U1C74_25290 [Phenylobacterium sp.]|nr:hypothetical protein [Phenylobacterium sp.]
MGPAMAGRATKKEGRNPRWRIALWSGAAAILLLPLAAMAVTEAVDWSAADFAALAVMLVAACGALELVFRDARGPRLRVVLSLTVVSAFLLTWAHLAVGVF